MSSSRRDRLSPDAAVGGSIGIAVAATLLDRFQTQNRAMLAANLSRYSDVARERLAP